MVTGTKKNVELKPLEWYADGGLVTERYVRKNKEWDLSASREVSGLYDRYDDMMKSFAQIVSGEKQNPWSYDYELELYKLILEACGVAEDFKSQYIHIKS